MKWIKSMVEDNSGGISSARVLMLIWGIGVFVIWCYTSFCSKTIASIPETVITVMLGTSAMKVVQRFGEKSTTETDEKSKTE